MVDFVPALDSLADQPQNLETAENHLMFTRARRRCLHLKPL
jgi:hypothetical protein